MSGVGVNWMVSRSTVTVYGITGTDANNYVTFNTTTDKFEFYIGGTKIAEIDSSGNIKMSGEITEGETF